MAPTPDPSQAAAQAPEFSVPVAVEALPPEGRDVQRGARDAEAAAVAQRLGVPGVRDLAVRAVVRPWDKGGVLVMGEVTAVVTQECGVTLEAFEAPYRADFERRYLPAHRLPGTRPNEGEVELDEDDLDAPDPFDGETVDIGEAAVEELALVLDPFPRKPDAALETAHAGPGGQGADAVPEAKENPFAVLAKLKESGGGTDGDDG